MWYVYVCESESESEREAMVQRFVNCLGHWREKEKERKREREVPSQVQGLLL